MIWIVTEQYDICIHIAGTMVAFVKIASTSIGTLKSTDGLRNPEQDESVSKPHHIVDYLPGSVRVTFVEHFELLSESADLVLDGI